MKAFLFHPQKFLNGTQYYETHKLLIVLQWLHAQIGKSEEKRRIVDLLGMGHLMSARYDEPFDVEARIKNALRTAFESKNQTMLNIVRNLKKRFSTRDTWLSPIIFQKWKELFLMDLKTQFNFSHENAKRLSDTHIYIERNGKLSARISIDYPREGPSSWGVSYWDAINFDDFEKARKKDELLVHDETSIRATVEKACADLGRQLIQKDDEGPSEALDRMHAAIKAHIAPCDNPKLHQRRELSYETILDMIPGSSLDFGDNYGIDYDAETIRRNGNPPHL
jgi:hypothetical protein